MPPEQEQLEQIPPTPPTGGERVFSEFQNLEAEYPRQDPADRPKAFRVWKKLAPDAVRVGAMLTVLAALKQSDQWRNDGGRYVPRLSRWLAGWLVGDGPPLPQPEPPRAAVPTQPVVVLTPEQVVQQAELAKAARAKLAAMRPPRGAKVASCG